MSSYGKVRNFKGEWKGDCPFRYQGQYEDAETGLYYNRFRYYSPDEGIYISQDPIRLVGGDNLYGYVHDPNGWVDRFGLNCELEGTDDLDEVSAVSTEPQPNGSTTDFTVENGQIMINGSPANGWSDFVITNDGTLELGSGHYHLSGQADSVKGAGEIYLDNGKVTAVNGNSGHYQPGIESTVGSIQTLKDNNLTTEDVVAIKR